MAALGFDAEWHCIPASAVGAHHLRDRVWIIATNADRLGSREQSEPERGRSGATKSQHDGPRGSMANADREGELQPSGVEREIWRRLGNGGEPVSNTAVLDAIYRERPDLRLHGFGVNTQSLHLAQDYLYSADSMAWSFAARRQGRNGNSWREAKA